MTFDRRFDRDTKFSVSGAAKVHLTGNKIRYGVGTPERTQRQKEKRQPEHVATLTPPIPSKPPSRSGSQVPVRKKPERKAVVSTNISQAATPAGCKKAVSLAVPSLKSHGSSSKDKSKTVVEPEKAVEAKRVEKEKVTKAKVQDPPGGLTKAQVGEVVRKLSISGLEELNITPLGKENSTEKMTPDKISKKADDKKLEDSQSTIATKANNNADSDDSSSDEELPINAPKPFAPSRHQSYIEPDSSESEDEEQQKPAAAVAVAQKEDDDDSDDSDSESEDEDLTQPMETAKVTDKEDSNDKQETQKLAESKKKQEAEKKKAAVKTIEEKIAAEEQKQKEEEKKIEAKKAAEAKALAKKNAKEKAAEKKKVETPSSSEAGSPIKPPVLTGDDSSSDESDAEPTPKPASKPVEKPKAVEKKVEDKKVVEEKKAPTPKKSALDSSDSEEDYVPPARVMTDSESENDLLAPTVQKRLDFSKADEDSSDSDSDASGGFVQTKKVHPPI